MQSFLENKKVERIRVANYIINMTLPLTASIQGNKKWLGPMTRDSVLKSINMYFFLFLLIFFI